MDYLPHGPDDVRAMLEAIGVASTDELFADIPAARRFPAVEFPAGLAAALSEPEAAAHLAALARSNRTPADGPWFLGGGWYRHYVPAVVPALAGRGEFLTSYTPYQPEVSQGTLQALFEYQSMMASILGMDAVNASHYDGATALAEAALMARAVKPGRVLVPDTLNPLYRGVLDTYLAGLGAAAESYSGPPCAAGLGTSDAAGGPGLSAFVVQWPDFVGQLWELEGLAERVHAAGGLLIIHVDPVMLGIVRSPGSLGADIVTAEGQGLGIPMGFGGPGLGVMACTQALVRRLPGRLVGQAFDHEGRRGFTLTLSAREQHIRREKAVSNICSNQGLMALSACIHLASLGPRGLAEVGTLCRERAWECATRLAALPGFAVPALEAAAAEGACTPEVAGFCPQFFKEFLVRTPVDAEALVCRAREVSGVEAGLPLARVLPAGARPGQDRELLVCCTELTTEADSEALVRALAAAAADVAGGRRKP